MLFAKRMNTRLAVVLLGILLIAGASCRSHPAELRRSAPAIQTPPPNDIERLSALHPLLKEQWLAYRTKEGDEHRSGEFSNLAMQLDETCFSGRPFRTRSKPPERAKDIEVLSFLGLPDRGTRVGANAMYVYSYWRTDTKSKWVAIVEVRDGLLDRIGWNDASINDFSTLRQYRKWSDVLGGVH